MFSWHETHETQLWRKVEIENLRENLINGRREFFSSIIYRRNFSIFTLSMILSRRKLFPLNMFCWVEGWSGGETYQYGHILRLNKCFDFLSLLAQRQQRRYEKNEKNRINKRKCRKRTFPTTFLFQWCHTAVRAHSKLTSFQVKLKRPSVTASQASATIEKGTLLLIKNFLWSTLLAVKKWAATAEASRVFHFI